MALYTMDTNHVPVLLRDGESLAYRFRRDGPDAFVLVSPVLGELYGGAFGGTRKQENLDKLNHLLLEVRVEPYTQVHAERYGMIAAYLRRIGRPIGAVDVQLAAMALSMDLTVLSGNKHFSYVPDLRVENWLV